MLSSLGMNVNKETFSETVSWSQEIILETAQLKMKANRERFIDFIKSQEDKEGVEHLLSSIAIGVDIQYNRSHRPPPHGVAPYATAIFLLHGVHAIDGIKDLEGQVRKCFVLTCTKLIVLGDAHAECLLEGARGDG